MTPIQWKILGGAVLVLLLWPRRSSAAPIASVDFEAPTVTGPGSDLYGGQDYGTAPIVVPDDPAPSPDVQRAIDESTAAIMAAGGYPE